MRHLDFLVFSPNVEQEGVLVLDDEFAFLEPGDVRSYLLQFLAADAKQILDDGVRDGLLFHDQRVLRVGVEVKMLALETLHVLRRQNDAQTLVSSHRNQIPQWAVIEIQHVVCLVNDGEMA